MKIRSGFVSNSSTTSFIVAINHEKLGEKCPHCGRSSPNILDMLEDSYGDTCMEWTDPTDYLTNLKLEVASNIADLEKWEGKADNEEVTFTYNTYKVADLRKWANSTIKNNNKEIELIEKAIEAGKSVVHFRVDYNDSTIEQIVREQIENGELEEISEIG